MLYLLIYEWPPSELGTTDKSSDNPIIDNYRVQTNFVSDYRLKKLSDHQYWTAFISVPIINKLTDLATIIEPKRLSRFYSQIIDYQTFLLLGYRIIGFRLSDHYLRKISDYRLLEPRKNYGCPALVTIDIHVLVHLGMVLLVVLVRFITVLYAILVHSQMIFHAILVHFGMVHYAILAI